VIVNIPLLWLVLALVALVGIPVVAFIVSETTLLQSGVADAYRGRVFGAYGTMQALMLLIGMGLASALGDRVGIVPLFDITGGLYVLSGLIALALLGSQGATAVNSPALSSDPAP
jgi:hypothetical protein